MKLDVTNNPNYKTLYIEEEKTSYGTRWNICTNYLVNNGIYQWTPYTLGVETGLGSDAMHELMKKHNAVYGNNLTIRFKSKKKAQDFVDEIEAILLMEKLTEE